MHTLFAGTTQCVGAVGAKGPFVVAAFRAALLQVAGRHEILGSTIVERPSGLHFTPAPAAAPSVTVLEGRDWQEVYQSLNSSPLSLQRSPWAVFVVPNGSKLDAWEVLLTTHHALMDGGSIALFMEELFAAYAAQLAGSQIPSGAFRPLPPAVETMLPRALSWSEFQAHQARVAAEQPRLEPEPHRSAAPHAERSTRSLFFSLEPEVVQAVASTASRHGVSLNSWVAACLLQAVEAHSSRRGPFALGTAYSLRALCDEVDPQDLGCHLAVVATHHEQCLARPLPDVAREHARSLTQAVFDSARHPREVELDALRRSLEPLREIRAFVADLAYTYAESGLKRAYGPLQIEHFFASASRALGASSIVLHGLRHDGVVHFTMNYTSPLQSGQWVNEVTSAFQHVLRDSVTTEKVAASVA
ncbi:MAG TPA: condensation domain-containing protein [Polyangiaceae bacterium]|jgi:hypothetical protein|nr:condensation domain-containing protein [Polyangiaceae bacterium]